MKAFKVILRNSKENKELTKTINSFNFASAVSEAHKIRSSCGENWYDWKIITLFEVEKV
jgi:hypothetical protein|tara:strand:+ start:6586 stop:6762 length:177 start_codon:yes stop_codon:yes gene_type:complete